MTKRQKIKADKLKRKAIHDMLDLALDINGMQASEQETTGDHPTAFFYMSGHIGKVEVDIHARGWHADDRPDISVRTYMDEDLSGAVRELSRTKAALKGRERSRDEHII